jgi:hypothetical protein
MSDIRLCVRDHEGDHWTDIHGSDGDRLIAACSNNPQTLAELCKAAETYAQGAARWVQYFERGQNFHLWDAGLVIIDLTARLIVVDSGYSDPQLVDQVYYHNGSCKTSTAIPYDLTADDWLITKQVQEWETLARRRRDHLHGVVHAHPLEQSPWTFATARKLNPAPLAE